MRNLYSNPLEEYFLDLIVQDQGQRVQYLDENRNDEGLDEVVAGTKTAGEGLAALTEWLIKSNIGGGPPLAEHILRQVEWGPRVTGALGNLAEAGLIANDLYAGRTDEAAEGVVDLSLSAAGAAAGAAAGGALSLGVGAPIGGFLGGIVGPYVPELLAHEPSGDSSSRPPMPIIIPTDPWVPGERERHQANLDLLFPRGVDDLARIPPSRAVVASDARLVRLARDHAEKNAARQ